MATLGRSVVASITHGGAASPTVHAQARQLDEHARRVLGHATTRDRTTERRKVAVEPIIEGELAQIGTGIETGCKGAGATLVHCDPVELQKAVGEIIDNAAQALEGRQGGWIRATVEHRNSEVTITVLDNGTGMDRATEQHALDALEGRWSGHLGMGLSLVRASAERNHGTLQIRSLEGKGTMVRLALPAWPEHAEPSGA